MSEFNLDLSMLRKNAKPDSEQAIAKIDAAGEEVGFVDRAPRGKTGRKKSARTGQVHAKVMPEVAVEIANEATRRGVVQGVIIEEAWALYKARQT